MFAIFMIETVTLKNFVAAKVFQFFVITEIISKAVDFKVCQFFVITVSITRLSNLSNPSS